jgi:hypothetical protein
MLRGYLHVRLRGSHRSLDIQRTLGSRGLGSRREEQERRTALKGSHHSNRERRRSMIGGDQYVLDVVSWMSSIPICTGS